MTLLLWCREHKIVHKLIDIDEGKYSPQGCDVTSNYQKGKHLVPCHSQSRSRPATVRLVSSVCPPSSSCPNTSWDLVSVTLDVFSVLSSWSSHACCAPSAQEAKYCYYPSQIFLDGLIFLPRVNFYLLTLSIS